VFVEVPDEYGYGGVACVERWSNGDPRDIIERAWDADVLMVYDSPDYLEFALRFEKPVLFRALGSHSRREPERVRELLKSEFVKRATAGTADLALALDIEFAGAPFPKLPRATKTRHIAVHSPSNRALKGTAVITEMAFEAGWPLEIIEGMAHDDVILAKRSSSLVIDQFGDPPHPDGLGVAGIEAMAMGLPVIGRASGPVQKMYRDVSCPAFLVGTPEGFVSQLRVLHDVEVRTLVGEAGRRWVRSFHDAETRAREDLEALA